MTAPYEKWRGMKIVNIARHACIRVMKIGLPLISRGYDMHLITNKISQYSDHYNSVSSWFDLDHLYKTIKLHSDADIFHVHNEPSWFVTVVKEVFPDKPVVLDVHDTMLLRRSQEEVDKANNSEIFRHTIDERNNFQLADGLVFVCNPMRDMVLDEYKTTVPYAVVPSMLPERFYRVDFSQWIGGLVYEGRIDTEDELDGKWDFFQYANYIDMARECARVGMDFHIYTPRKNASVREQYEKVCYLHPPQELSRLIKLLGSHDWGLVGNCKVHEEWKHALPNKLFEYMAGCTPVVCFNADASWDFIKDIGVGIKVDSVEELAQRWAEHRECRKNVVKYRAEFTMERHIHKIEKLYKELV